MQEEVNQKVVCLAVSTAKMTEKIFLKTINTYLHRKNNPKIRHGKQTLRQLKAQNVSLSNVDITQENIKSFLPIARKYRIDFALKKDTLSSPPKYHMFFKGNEADTITMAFQEYTAKMLNREEKPSIHKTLAKLKAQTKKQQQEKTIKKERSFERQR